ncbi:efflux RND transporter periplasmic adaptor subunit [uncultured Paludibaculum sp.]|uniref:efflux RND transporter periplasmic adaptor subunit n=1 Tax=uncultured Paludibaculum sp. TaxID=1765020 RepID=UPI002AAC4833|nr:efflux RND transporter periplasmic adaptor subunit [uncultured Paludibaculum sp.]
MMSRTKSTGWATVAAALMVAALAGSYSLMRGRNTERYRTAPVTRGDLLQTVSATGNPNAVVTVQVGTQVSGNIQALYADFNSRVSKGDLIARIDPTLFDARVQQAQAALESARIAVVNAQAQIQARQADILTAKANVAAASANVLKAQAAVVDARSKYERRHAMEDDKIFSKEDIETAKATLDTAEGSLTAAKAQEDAARQGVASAEAQLAVARAGLDSSNSQVKQSIANLMQSQIDLDHTYIRAPVNGTVVARHVDVGQTVAASLQAPTIFEIAEDLAKMQVDTNVSEADIGKVQVGQESSFSVDAYPGRIFHGAVREIRKAPINVQNVITYDVVIGVDNSDLKLFPGMTATVKIVTGRKEGVLKVPNAALRFKPDNAAPATASRRGATATALWTLGPDGKPRRVMVMTGATDGVSTEVTGQDLQQGAPVIVAAVSGSGSAAKKAAPFGGAGNRGPRL